MPAVSLVIPAFNREKFIAAAVGSVLRQTLEDFELVVWDDGSTDTTVEVARRAAGDDPRVRIVAAEHRGISATLNSAIELLSGKYIAWVDSDDGIVPTTLEETRNYLDAHPDVGMVYSDYLTIDESGKVLGQGSAAIAVL